MKKILWIAICFLAPLGVVAQEATPKPLSQVPMIIEPADADVFRDIIESTVPPRYNAALIRWYMAIFQRQQAKQAEMAKAAKSEYDQ